MVCPADQNTRHRTAHRATLAVGQTAPVPPDSAHTGSPPPALPLPARWHPDCRQACSLFKKVGCGCSGFLTATTRPHPA